MTDLECEVRRERAVRKRKRQTSRQVFIAVLSILPAVFASRVVWASSVDRGAYPEPAKTGLTVHAAAGVTVAVTDPNVVYSPYNWYLSGSDYAQSPNPGAYLKLGFTGSSLAIGVDVSPLVAAHVPDVQYPLIRYSVDSGPPKTVRLASMTMSLTCATGLMSGSHTLLLQYVAGYVFLDFWTPVNVVRVTGFSLDSGASTIPPSGVVGRLPKNALFLGDSITNGDNSVATFAGGITNAVETQDATVGYAPVVAAGIGEEYGIVAYGGASWDGRAADRHTPGLMTLYAQLDRVHSRLVAGKFSRYRTIFSSIWERTGLLLGAMCQSC